MTPPLHTSLILLLLVGAVVMAAGCVGGPTLHPNETTGTSLTAAPIPSPSSQITCPPAGHMVYRVVQGQTFVWQGTIPDYTGTPAEYSIYTEKSPLYYRNLSVEKEGSFVITVDRNATQSGDMVGYRKSSPYDHICVRSAGWNQCRDLLIVENTTQLNATINPGWIRIDPVPDPIIPADILSAYTGNFHITGTTSLPPGARLNITLDSLCFLPCPKVLTPGKIGCCGGEYYSGETRVTEDLCGMGVWSLQVNTSPDRLGMTRINGIYDDENEFEILVEGQNRTNDDNLWDAAHFVVRVKDEP